MAVATLIAVRPVIVDGHTVDPGSAFTVPAKHAPALLATGEAAVGPEAAASYAAIYPTPYRGPGHPLHWPGIAGLLGEARPSRPARP